MATDTVNVYQSDGVTLKNTCEPGWARILLRENRASIISRDPFSIAMKKPEDQSNKTHTHTNK